MCPRPPSARFRVQVGPEHVDDTHYVRIYLARLRHKLEPQPARPRHLITEAGMGYRFLAEAPRQRTETYGDRS